MKNILYILFLLVCITSCGGTEKGQPSFNQYIFSGKLTAEKSGDTLTLEYNEMIEEPNWELIKILVSDSTNSYYCFYEGVDSDDTIFIDKSSVNSEKYNEQFVFGKANNYDNTLIYAKFDWIRLERANNTIRLIFSENKGKPRYIRLYTDGITQESGLLIDQK